MFNRQNFKAGVVINVFRGKKETMCKELKENMTAMNHQIENVDKKIKI